VDTAKYAELFLTESRDNIVALNEALLELERNPTSAAHLDSLFRAVHTVKGMAGVMGYGQVVDLAHAMETMLAQVRDGSRPLASDDSELLFEAADALDSAIERSVSGDESSLDVAPICERLRAATGLSATGTWSATTEYKVPLPPGEGLAVQVRLASDAPLKGARAFLIVQRARALGEVLATTPDEAALKEEKFGTEFSIRLRSDASSERITNALRDAGYVERVSVRRDAEGPLPPTANPVERADAAWATGTLKAPLQRYVRIDLKRLDGLMNQIGELVIARGRLAQVVSRYTDPDLDDAATAVARLVGELQDGILSSRMVPVWQVFDRFPRVVRDAARSLSKEIEFVLEGREIELDRALLDQIGDPLVHLLRNAVDHGIETPDTRESAGKARAGRLVLSASRDRSAVVIRVTDDGRGIDRVSLLRRAQADGDVDSERDGLTDDEVLRLIARPGFTTAAVVTDLSGRGVGVDAVVNRIRALGGSVELHSEVGAGTTFSLRLPVTLAILPALLARVEAETYALPLTHIRETLQLSSDVVRRVRGKEVLLLRDEVLPLLSLRRVVDLPGRDVEGSQVVVLEVADRRAGLVVDQLMGQQEVVVKPFDAARGAAACFSGATILSDGLPALILEATSLL
jgi:two-component system, chemotaxis family, sensor kinase CheA